MRRYSETPTQRQSYLIGKLVTAELVNDIDEDARYRVPLPRGSDS